jgi:hypothetical protein
VDGHPDETDGAAVANRSLSDLPPCLGCDRQPQAEGRMGVFEFIEGGYNPQRLRNKSVHFRDLLVSGN